MISDNYTVSRGSLCCRVQEQWSEIKRLCEKEKDIPELKTFINGLRDSGDYSGIHFTNTFRVNHPIGLTGIGFFGPHEVESATYDVLIEIQRLSTSTSTSTFVKNSGNEVLLSTAFYRVPAEKGKIFRIEFDNPFMIEPYTFYNIRFQLDGPVTGICDPKTLLKQCFGGILHGRRIEFEFLNGSLQMPEMLYVLF